jgi:hypothetical protein
MTYDKLMHLSPAADAVPADPVRLAAFACLARFTGSSREHTESDLRCYLRLCGDRGLDPLAARRLDLEQYIRWMHEACRFKPSTICASGLVQVCCDLTSASRAFRNRRSGPVLATAAACS